MCQYRLTQDEFGGCALYEDKRWTDKRGSSSEATNPRMHTDDGNFASKKVATQNKMGPDELEEMKR